MELSVLERILLLNALPQEGDLTTIMIVRELREQLSFSEDEHTELKFKDTDNGSIQWAGGVSKKVEIEGKALEISRLALKTLDEQKKLNVGHVSLYQKIVGDN